MNSRRKCRRPISKTVIWGKIMPQKNLKIYGRNMASSIFSLETGFSGSQLQGPKQPTHWRHQYFSSSRCYTVQGMLCTKVLAHNRRTDRVGSISRCTAQRKVDPTPKLSEQGNAVNYTRYLQFSRYCTWHMPGTTSQHTRGNVQAVSSSLTLKLCTPVQWLFACFSSFFFPFRRKFEAFVS